MSLSAYTGDQGSGCGTAASAVLVSAPTSVSCRPDPWVARVVWPTAG